MNEKWVTLPRAAQYLGVHPATVRRMTMGEGALPFFRGKNGKLAFWGPDLDAFRQNLPYPSAERFQRN